MPLSTVLTSACLAVGWDGHIELDPSPEDLEASASRHVLSYASNGELVIAESEGSFTATDLRCATEVAERKCRDEMVNDKEHHVTGYLGHGPQLESTLRAAIRNKLEQEQRWRPIDE